MTMSEVTSDEDWDLVITSERKWWDLRLGEIWRYRDLILLFVRRDFVALYKQTILGPLYHIINPIISSVIFTIIFGRIAGLPTDELPPYLFYLSGTVTWSYFSTSFTKTSNTFTANQAIFGKVYFPRLVLPISTVITQMISFAIRFATFLGFLVYYIVAGYAVKPNVSALLLPVLLLIMAGIGLGGGIIVSSLTTKYRDLQILVTYGVQFFMYVTPVIYPASLVPARVRPLYFLNPIAPVVEAFRYGFLGEGTIDGVKLLYSVVFTVVIMVMGLVLYTRIEANFMDTV